MTEQVYQKHSELFHYTTLSSLSFILEENAENRCIWATHFNYLNDSSEFKAFFEKRLKKILDDVLRPHINKALIVSQEADAFYQRVTGVTRDDRIGSLIEDLRKRFHYGIDNICEPYIMSMCSAKNNYIRNNGLLSQWRGYGADGGCAIVFDTYALNKLIEKENQEFDYINLKLDKTCYYDDETHTYDCNDLNSSEETIKSKVSEYMTTRVSDGWEPTMDALVEMGTRHKHWGFHEEQEVRIIALKRKSQQTHKSDKQPVINYFYSRSGSLVPHLKLFKGSELPIIRVIIGPHPERDKRVEAVNRLLIQRGFPSSVQAVPSDIPYLGK